MRGMVVVQTSTADVYSRLCLGPEFWDYLLLFLVEARGTLHCKEV